MTALDDYDLEAVRRVLALTYTDGACDLECPLCDCDGMQEAYATHACTEVLQVLGLVLGSTERSTESVNRSRHRSLPPIARTDGRTDVDGGCRDC